MENVQLLKHDSTVTPDVQVRACTMCNESTVTLKEQVSQIGATENVRWTASEVRGSGWKPGWYKAEVQRYCDESYVVTLLYISEQNEVIYEEKLSSSTIATKKIKLLLSLI